MTKRKDLIVVALATFCLTASLFMIGSIRSAGIGEYNPWADINNDGIVDIYDAILLSNAFNKNGQNLTKASVMYDSGWVNITDKCGKYVDIVHNLNITNWNDEKILVDITGKTTIGGELLRYLGMAYSGQMEWNKTYGGSANVEEARSMVQTSDGGYALAGVTATASERDFWFVKTDANGNELWNKTYGGTSYDEAYSVVKCSDGGYALAGYTDSFGAGSSDF